MTIQIDGRSSRKASSTVLRRLLVIWRDPESRRFSVVGLLDHLSDGRFAFSYAPGASSTSGFSALDEYPDFDSTYVSDALPVFFTNRVMSAGRASYSDYLERLGLSGVSPEDVPLEVLVRSGGGRATDTFHIVEAPIGDASDFQSRFFVSGSRHIVGAAERIDGLAAGDELTLRPDPVNPANNRAVLLDAHNDDAIGWVPDWLCDQVLGLVEDGFELRATVDRVNRSAPARLQVLCRIDVRRPAS